MNKNILAASLITIGGFILSWLLMSFIFWNWNPGIWAEQKRAGMLLLGAVLTGIGNGIYFSSKN
jgi:hypothetical protein